MSCAISEIQKSRANSFLKSLGYGVVEVAVEVSDVGEAEEFGVEVAAGASGSGAGNGSTTCTTRDASASTVPSPSSMRYTMVCVPATEVSIETFVTSAPS